MHFSHAIMQGKSNHYRNGLYPNIYKLNISHLNHQANRSYQVVILVLVVVVEVVVLWRGGGGHLLTNKERTKNEQ